MAARVDQFGSTRGLYVGKETKMHVGPPIQVICYYVIFTFFVYLPQSNTVNHWNAMCLIFQ